MKIVLDKENSFKDCLITDKTETSIQIKLNKTTPKGIDCLQYFDQKSFEKRFIPINYPLVGHLNRSFGFNGFKPILVGTPIFEMDDRFVFFVQQIDKDELGIVRFYKKDLTPNINFLKN